MPALTIDPAVLKPQAIDGAASTQGPFNDEVIAAINDHAALLDDLVTSGSNLISMTNGELSEGIICQPVYAAGTSSFGFGIADGSGKSVIIGLIAAESIASAEDGYVAVGGVFVATTAQWDAVCGTSGGLTPNTVYYLDPDVAGKLTATAPESPADDGDEVVQVLTALSTTQARLAIQPPILL